MGLDDSARPVNHPLDLVEYLEGFGTTAPMLVLCVARPELLDARPGWAGKSLMLDPLPEADVLALIDDLGRPDLDATVRERNLRVMDSTAIAHCMEHNMPILVFNYKQDGNILRAVKGEKVGTLISSRPVTKQMA